MAGKKFPYPSLADTTLGEKSFGYQVTRTPMERRDSENYQWFPRIGTWARLLRATPSFPDSTFRAKA